jgi:hypothetical protein
MSVLYGTRTICLGLDDEIFTSRDMQLLLGDAGINDVVSVIFGNINDSVNRQSEMLELALAKGKDLREQRKPVFFLVLNHIALYEAFVARLEATSKEDTDTTTIYFGGDTVGAEPEVLANLDAVITFDFGRAKRGLSSTPALVSSKKE